MWKAWFVAAVAAATHVGCYDSHRDDTSGPGGRPDSGSVDPRGDGGFFARDFGVSPPPLDLGLLDVGPPSEPADLGPPPTDGCRGEIIGLHISEVAPTERVVLGPGAEGCVGGLLTLTGVWVAEADVDTTATLLGAGSCASFPSAPEGAPFLCSVFWGSPMTQAEFDHLCAIVTRVPNRSAGCYSLGE